MAPFPSPLERTVASALLLLSTTSPPPPPPPPPLSPINSISGTDNETMPREGNQRKSSNASLSFSSIGSKSCSSYLTGEVSSEKVRRPHKLKIVSVEAGCRGITNIKVVKKSRSKVGWSSDNPNVTSIKPEANPSGSLSTEASCLSSSSRSSAIASPKSRLSTGTQKKPAANPEGSRKKDCGSAHIRRRAEAILKILSGGSFFSEMKIRRVLGDTPDTSKALRMLVRTKEVKRSGTGGRHDPFIYTRDELNRP